MTKNKIWITSIALLFLNFILKILYIKSQSVAGDEPFSIYHAQMNVLSIMEQLRQGNNPPLFEIFLHYWIKIFGINELAVRFPSMIFSSLTVFFIYRIGIRFYTYPFALFSSLIYSFSNYHLFFAHECRVYSLFAFLTTLSMYCFLEIINYSKERKYLVVLIIADILLLYAHYFGFFVLFTQFIAVVSISELRKNFFKSSIGVIFIISIAYIPNLQILFHRFFDTTKSGSWVKPPNGIESIYNMLWDFSNKPLTTILCIAVLVGAIIKFIVLKNYKAVSKNTKVILLWFLFPFLFMFIISYWLPMFLDRYLIFVSIGYYLILAIAVNYLYVQKTFGNNTIAGLIVVFFIITFRPNIDNKRHVKEAIEKIVALKDGNTEVIMCPYHFVLNFTYYYNQNIFKDADEKNVFGKIVERLKKEKIYAINSFDPALFDSEKIIYLDAAADFSFPNNNILNTLNKKYQLINTFRYYEVFNVYEFKKNKLVMN